MKSIKRQDGAHVQQPNFQQLRRFYQRIGAMAVAPQPDIEQLAEIIEKDFGFRQTVLRAVNSIRSGLLHPIHSVPHAVALLGFGRVRALAEAELDRIVEMQGSEYEAPSDKARLTTTNSNG